MDIFGIGPMELILILIVALMVFGPDKLPHIGAKLGRTMRDMRKATRAISYEINSTREAIGVETKELTEPFQEVAGAAKAAGTLVAAAKNPGQAIRDSVMKELNPPAEPAKTAADSGEGENTIAPPEAIQAASAAPGPASVETPLAPAEAALDAARSGPEQPVGDMAGLPEPAPLSNAEPPTPVAEPVSVPEAEPPATSVQLTTAGEPTPGDPPALSPSDQPAPTPSDQPAPKPKRKPRAKKPSEPTAAASDAGEQ